MKRYKVEYWNGDRLKPCFLSEISKSGKKDGVRLNFSIDGNKIDQYNFKNGNFNGIDKCTTSNLKNDVFINWKKNDFKGIKIIFHQ